MQDIDLEALARRAFSATTRVIILVALDLGRMLFHDVNTVLHTTGIAAMTWDAAPGTL